MLESDEYQQIAVVNKDTLGIDKEKKNEKPRYQQQSSRSNYSRIRAMVVLLSVLFFFLFFYSSGNRLRAFSILFPKTLPIGFCLNTNASFANKVQITRLCERVSLLWFWCLWCPGLFSIFPDRNTIPFSFFFLSFSWIFKIMVAWGSASAMFAYSTRRIRGILSRIKYVYSQKTLR